MDNFLNKNKKIISFVFLIFIIMFFVVSNNVLAEESKGTVSSLIPCGGNNQPECGYFDLFKLIQNVINEIIKLSIPIFAGLFAYAGILYMTQDVSGKKEQAKAIMKNAFWGFVLILSAWIIVSTILSVLLSDPYKDAIPLKDFQKSQL